MKTKQEIAHYISTMNPSELIELESMLIGLTYTEYVGKYEMDIITKTFGINRYGHEGVKTEE